MCVSQCLIGIVSGRVYRAVRIKLFTARVLCRAIEYSTDTESSY